jgi:hypothetical protein
MKPVISPKDLAIDYKAWNAKHSGLDGAFRLETEPLLDLICVGPLQKLLPIEADAIGNLVNDAVRSDVSSVTPRRIKKPYGETLSKFIVVDRRRDPKGFEGIKRVRRGAVKLQSQMASPTLRILKRITPLGRDFRRSHIRMTIQKRRKKNRYEAERGRRAPSHLAKLMRSKPRIRANEVEIKVYAFHGHCVHTIRMMMRTAQVLRNPSGRRTRLKQTSVFDT